MTDATLMEKLQKEQDQIKRLTDEQLMRKLHKTQNSIKAHVARGNGLKQQRSWQLVDRYSDLKMEAWERGGIWGRFCAETGCDEAHDAYDFWA